MPEKAASHHILLLWAKIHIILSEKGNEARTKKKKKKKNLSYFFSKMEKENLLLFSSWIHK